MTVVTTLDITGLTPPSTGAFSTSWVSKAARGGIYLHLTTPTDFGFRIIEIWTRRRALIASRRTV